MMISSTAMELEENRTDPSATLVTKRTIENSEDSDSFMGSSMDVRKMMAMVGVFYWFIMTVIVVPTACIATCWIFLCPIMLFSMPLFNRLEHELCRLVNDHWVSNGQYVGLNVVEYGDDIEKYADKRCLLLSNHLGLVDHFCIMTSVHDKKSLAGKYLWVIFQIWKATPLGAMWMTHGNYFINGGARKRASAIQSFREHLENKYWKHDYGWIVMYPEGSRLYLIRDAEVKFAEKNGFKPFVHCAHPRTGAAHAVLDVAGKDAKDNSLSRSGNPGPIEYIIDCTLGYPKGKVADMGQIMLGEWPDEDSTVAVHYRVYEAKPEFADEPTLRKWLYERYEEKDKLLAKFYETGKFPGEGRPVHFSLAKNLMVQVFWIALFYFHYNFWIRPLAGAALRYLLALF